MISIAKMLLSVGLLGLLCSSVYTGLVLFAVARFARRRRAIARLSAARHDESLPRVSLLKPLHGTEPGLEARLESFFKQDYPEYEILFCARQYGDPGLEMARRVAERYPWVPVQFLTTGEPNYSNAKVSSLERMAAAARFDILTISDSDVLVGTDYLREVAAPFADAAVGMVTCLYRGVADGGSLWSRLEAAGMSIEMSAGVLVAREMEGMQFALGPTMAVRRTCVEEIGGFGTLGRYCADDFVLGHQVAAHGHRVVLSEHVIDHIVLNEGLLQSMKHQVRWMRSTRFSRPKGHMGTALTFSVPFGVLVCVTAVLLEMPLLGFAALGWSILTRMLLAGVVGRSVVGERSLAGTVLLFPVRDLLGFGYWAASYWSNKILWRGEIFELLRDGVMRRCVSKAAASVHGGRG